MTRLGAKIPVEPLSDERLARVEQRIMAEFDRKALPRAPQRRWQHALRWMVPAVAAAGVLLAIYLNLRSTVTPAHKVQRVEDAQTVRIATDDRGASAYDMGDATVRAGLRTTLDVARDPAGGVDIELLSGRIDCEVEPRPGRARFVVHAGEVDVTVVGTVFAVERDELDRVRVTVTRGKVRVDAQDGSVVLAAGESWSGAAVLTADTRGHATGEHATEDRAAHSAASPDSDGDGDDARGHDDSSDDIDIGVAMNVDAPGTEALAERRSRRPRVESSESSESGKTTDRARRPARTRRSKAQPRRDARMRALARAKPARGRLPRGELADIMALEARDPEAAVARYREHALEHGSEAELALYSMAYVQYFELGRRAAALSSLRHYLRRFPKGAHTESVLWLRIRVLCEGDDRKACRAAAHTYLSRFPRGRHARLAGDIINWGM